MANEDSRKKDGGGAGCLKNGVGEGILRGHNCFQVISDFFFLFNKMQKSCVDIG